MEILRKLLFTPNATFTKLKPNKSIENNVYTFHLRTLVNLKLIDKKDKKYFLTDKGKD
jgi:DNA-binding HxlR family transcriptional regulator